MGFGNVALTDVLCQVLFEEKRYLNYCSLWRIDPGWVLFNVER